MKERGIYKLPESLGDLEFVLSGSPHGKWISLVEYEDSFLIVTSVEYRMTSNTTHIHFGKYLYEDIVTMERNPLSRNFLVYEVLKNDFTRDAVSKASEEGKLLDLLYDFIREDIDFLASVASPENANKILWDKAHPHLSML